MIFIKKIVVFQFLNVKQIICYKCVCVINIAKNSLNFDRSKSALNANLKTY